VFLARRIKRTGSPMATKNGFNVARFLGHLEQVLPAQPRPRQIRGKTLGVIVSGGQEPSGTVQPVRQPCANRGQKGTAGSFGTIEFGHSAISVINV
jgi:hypothetical protein